MSHDRVRIAWRHYSPIFFVALLCVCSKPDSLLRVPESGEGRMLVVRSRPFFADAMAFVPGTRRVWMVGRAQIGVSNDGGRTWNVFGSPGDAQLRVLAVADEKTVLAAGHHGVIVRKDPSNDAAWTQVHSSPDTGNTRNSLWALAIDPRTREAVAAGEDLKTVLLSRDAGATWTPTPIPLEIPANESFQGAAFTKQGLWLLCSSLLVHRDPAGAWRIVPLPAQINTFGIHFDEDGRQGFIDGYPNGFWTDDGGDHWTKAPVPDDAELVAVDFRRNLLYINEGVLKSAPRGEQTWKEISPTVSSQTRRTVALEPVSGDRVETVDVEESVGKAGEPAVNVVLPLTHILDFVMDPDGLRGWAAGEAGKVVATTDGGRHWNVIVPESQPQDRIFAITRTGNRLWALRNFTIDRSDDGGKSWTSQWRNPTTAAAKSFAVSGDGRHLLVGGREAIYEISEGSPPVARPFRGEEFSSLAMSADGRVALAASESGTLYRFEQGAWNGGEKLPVGFGRAHLAMTPDGMTAWCATDGGAILRSDDGGVRWDVVFTRPQADFKGLDFDDTGKAGIAITEGEMFRSADGGRTWFPLPQAGDDWLTACRVRSVDDAFVIGRMGSFLATEVTGRKPSISALGFIPAGGNLTPVVDVLPGAVPASRLQVAIDVGGTPSADLAREKLHREFKLGAKAPAWPREIFDARERYTFDVVVFDGWNIVHRVFHHRFAEPLWVQFIDWMGWRHPSVSEFFSKTIPRSVGLLVVVYYAVILLLFVSNPYAFIMWHERIAGRLPERLAGIAKVMAPLAVGSDRCIDALIERRADHARKTFASHTLLQDRAGWAPAPLKIRDEEYLQFSRPADLPSSSVYVAGLTEIRARLSSARTVISIQGPGGVGKSSLAFQIGRWASSIDAATRLFPHVALPVIVTAVERPLDEILGDAAASIFSWTVISQPLKEALLEKRRILAIIDGLSEMSSGSAANVDPLSTSRWTHAIVLTSRMATRIEGELIIAPLTVGLRSLDSALNSLVDQRLGANYFSGEQREQIRNRCMELLRTSETGGPAVPMLFLKLLIDRAAELSKNELSFDTLPSTFNGLVDSYVGGLLNEDSEMITAARQVAVVAIAPDLAPGWRPRSSYLSVVDEKTFEKLATSGLLERTGLSAAPLYKFSIDPVSEYLAAMEFVLRMQAGTLDATLAARLVTSSPGSTFRSAIAFCATYLGITNSDERFATIARGTKSAGDSTD